MGGYWRVKRDKPLLDARALKSKYLADSDYDWKADTDQQWVTLEIQTPPDERTAGSVISFHANDSVPDGLDAEDGQYVIYHKWHFFESPTHVGGPTASDVLDAADFPTAMKTGQEGNDHFDHKSGPFQAEDFEATAECSFRWDESRLGPGHDSATFLVVVDVLVVNITPGGGMKQVVYSSYDAIEVTVKRPADEGDEETPLSPDDPIATARQLNRVYVRNVERYNQFMMRGLADDGGGGIQAGDGGPSPDVQHQIHLWSQITELIRKHSRSGSNNIPELVEKLGIDEDTYSDEYWTKTLNESFRGVGIEELLGFGRSRIEQLEASSITATRGNLADPDDPPPFIAFGRRLVAYRQGVEKRGKMLVNYLHTGSLLYTAPDKKIFYSAMPVPHNRFWRALQGRPYFEQLRILDDVFADLSQSDIGKEFLGDLFTDAGRGANATFFDPVAVYRPPEVTPGEKTNPKVDTPVVAVTADPDSESSGRSEYFDDTGLVQTEVSALFSGPALTAAARAYVTAAVPLSRELAVGASYFRARKAGNGPLDADRILVDFYFGVFSKFVDETTRRSILEAGLAVMDERSDDDLSADLDAAVQRVTDIATGNDSGGLSGTLSDVDLLVGTVLGQAEGVLSADSLFGDVGSASSGSDAADVGGPPSLSKGFAAGVGAILSAWDLALVGISLGEGLDEEGYVRPEDLESVAGVLAGHLEDGVEDYADWLEGSGDEQLAKVWSRNAAIVKNVMAAVEIIGIVSDVIDIAEMFEHGDDDGAYWSIGGVALATLSFAIGYAGISLGVVGVVIGLVEIILSQIALRYVDPDGAKYVEPTIFGRTGLASAGQSNWSDPVFVPGSDWWQQSGELDHLLERNYHVPGEPQFDYHAAFGETVSAGIDTFRLPVQAPLTANDDPKRRPADGVVYRANVPAQASRLLSFRSPLGVQNLSLSTVAHPRIPSSDYHYALSFEVAADSPAAESGALYVRPYVLGRYEPVWITDRRKRAMVSRRLYGKLDEAWKGLFFPVLHKVCLADVDHTRGSDDWQSRCPYHPPEVRNAEPEPSPPPGAQSSYEAAILSYFVGQFGSTDLPDQFLVGASDLLTHSVLSADLGNDAQFAGVDVVEVAHPYDSKPYEVTIGSPVLPALLGVRPWVKFDDDGAVVGYQFGGSGDGDRNDVYLEFLFVPEAAADHVEDTNVNEDIGLSRMPGVRRQIVKVEFDPGDLQLLSNSQFDSWIANPAAYREAASQ